jgi:cell fate (sporulation/competence/biofilm development) regulator YmcA (YheA/YmcA/DUF963 family)
VKPLNKEIEELALRINEELKNEEIVKEFFKYQEAIRKSNLDEMEEEIKILQQKIVNALNDNKMDEYEKLKDEYYQLKSEYDSHPLLVNYQYLTESVNDLLQQIAFIIDKELNEK